MSNQIACPNCRTKINTNEVMWDQLSLRIRSELEFEFHDRNAAICEARRELEELQAKVDAKKLALDQIVADEVNRVRTETSEEMKAKMVKSYELEIKVRDQQVIGLRQKLCAAEASQNKLMENERKLLNKIQTLQNAVSKQLEKDREKSRQQVLQQPAVDNSQDRTKGQNLIGEFRQQLDQLKSRLRQRGVLQQSGEKDRWLMDMLRDTFDPDSINSVPTDIVESGTLQRVHGSRGENCGSILWAMSEARFETNDLLKLQEASQMVGAHIVVFVTDTLPEGVDSFGMIDGVWVASRNWAKSLAAALRVGLINLYKTNLPPQQPLDSADPFFEFLTSPDFQRRIAGTVIPPDSGNSIGHRRDVPERTPGRPISSKPR